MLNVLSHRIKTASVPGEVLLDKDTLWHSTWKPLVKSNKLDPGKPQDNWISCQQSQGLNQYLFCNNNNPFGFFSHFKLVLFCYGIRINICISYRAPDTAVRKKRSSKQPFNETLNISFLKRSGISQFSKATHLFFGTTQCSIMGLGAAMRLQVSD